MGSVVSGVCGAAMIQTYRKVMALLTPNERGSALKSGVNFSRARGWFAGVGRK